MQFVIDPHTLLRAEERGANEVEIPEVLQSGTPMAARLGRVAKFKVYPFGRQWRSRNYEQKRVEVVYTIEGDSVTTVTVYVFYGKWQV